MRRSFLHLLGGVLFSLPMLFASCGNGDNALEEIINGGGSGGGGTEVDHSKEYLVYSYSTALDSVWTDIPSDAIVWTSDLTEFELAAGTYVVAGADIKCAGQLVLKGDVNIILKDNCKLTLDNGIIYDTTNDVGSLNIYGQGFSSSMGQLVVNNDTPVAFDPSYPTYKEAHAIYVVELTIHGGKINTTADTGTTLCSSGSGLGTKGGDMAIYAGEITNQGPSDAINVDEGNLNIHGGTITTIAQKSNYGIYATSASTLGNINITGGSITATGAADGICAKNITIDGGTVTANGGDGGGEGIRLYSGSLIINDGTLIANGGDGDALINKGGDAIKAPTIEINGGTVIATGGKGDNGDGGIGVSGQFTGTLTVNGGSLNATGGEGDGASSWGGEGIYCKNVTITGGIVTATGKMGSAGISSQDCINISGGIINATGGVKSTYGASGIEVSIGDLIVNGGTITANSGTGKAAIYVNNTMEVTDGNINAIGGEGGQGIIVNGGGSPFKVSGGTVTAMAGAGDGVEGINVDGESKITGGTVNATGSKSSSGTGGKGFFSNAITLEGGTITATGGDATGGNYDGGHGLACSDVITVDGGTLIATGGAGYDNHIGGNGINGDIKISDCVLVTATSGEKGALAGINNPGINGNITDGSGGTLTFEVKDNESDVWGTINPPTTSQKRFVQVRKKSI